MRKDTWKDPEYCEEQYKERGEGIQGGYESNERENVGKRGQESLPLYQPPFTPWPLLLPLMDRSEIWGPGWKLSRERKGEIHLLPNEIFAVDSVRERGEKGRYAHKETREENSHDWPAWTPSITAITLSCSIRHRCRHFSSIYSKRFLRSNMKMQLKLCNSCFLLC